MTATSMLTKIFGLGLVLSASTAIAGPGEFNGSYDMQYANLGGDMQVCVKGDGIDQCAFVNLQVRLVDGEITDESINELTANSIDAIEGNLNRDLRPRVEDAVYNAVDGVWGEVSDEINYRLDGMPRQMQMTELPYVPGTISVTFQTGHDDLMPAMGEIQAETGRYSILGLFQGEIQREAEYTGFGVAAIPIDTYVEYDGYGIHLAGVVFSNYETWPTKIDETDPMQDPEPQIEPAPEEPGPTNEVPPEPVRLMAR